MDRTALGPHRNSPFWRALGTDQRILTEPAKLGVEFLFDTKCGVDVSAPSDVAKDVL